MEFSNKWKTLCFWKEIPRNVLSSMFICMIRFSPNDTHTHTRINIVRSLTIEFKLPDTNFQKKNECTFNNFDVKHILHK